MKKNLLLSLLFLNVVCGVMAATPGLPFIRDDYARALAEAKEKKTPIFVECWAPW